LFAVKYEVLVVGHADADGHLIADQVRRNLALIESFNVNVLVDPARTRDHKAWKQLDAIEEIADADYVFFVDMMFSPASYIEEAKALTDFTRSYPDKRFFLIDHHPLPLRRLEIADNLRVIYRPDVFECTLGPRTGMMVVAAICEKQAKEVDDLREPLHDALAVGIKRAAALGGALPGEKLLALIRANRWDALLELGNDDPRNHYLPRGRRSSSQTPSKALRELEKTAIELLSGSGSRTRRTSEKENQMAYDADISQQQLTYDTGRRSLQRNTPASEKDLGVIITLLEVAALSLTTNPGSTFTFDELIKEANEIGGKKLDERDVRIVLQKANFLQKVGKEFRLK